MFELPIDTHVLAIVGLVLVASQLGGHAANRLGAPRVTGYLVTGLVIGPSVLGLVDEGRVVQLDVLVDVALGVIAFLVGGSLRLAQLRPLGRSIFAITVGEATGAFLVTSGAVAAVLPFVVELAADETFWRSVVPVALVVGALCAATAPAAVLAIVHEYRADGPLSRTVLGVVALDDAIAIVLFAVTLNVADAMAGQEAFSAVDAFLAPAGDVAVSALVGVAGGLALRLLGRVLPGRETLLAMTVGLVLLVGGVAESLGGSLLLANMAFGVFVANLVRRQERFFRAVEDVEELVFGAFFVLAGAHLDLGVVGMAAGLGAALLLGRFGGKLAGAWFGARASGAPTEVRRYAGLALIPQAGVAIGLVLRIRTTGISSATFDLILAAVLTAVLVNALVTPFALRFALRRAGEIHSS